jgi:hypothetical protein
LNAVAQLNTTLPVNESESRFALAQRQAKALAQSDLVPQAYRGNIPNTLLAMEIASRIGASPLLVMQNLYLVQGKPSWSSSFLIATVNACGRFSPLRFEVVGTDAAAKDYKVRAYATDKESGERCDGPWITWKMVEAEGWNKKGGSKWLSLPDLMFRYRAAGFWTRLFAPEVSMGILTAEEARDVWGGPEMQPTAPTEHGNLRTLEAQLTGQTIEGTASEVDPDAPTSEGVLAAIEAATTVDELNDAFDLARDLPKEQVPALVQAYELRRDKLELDAQ